MSEENEAAMLGLNCILHQTNPADATRSASEIIDELIAPYLKHNGN